MKQPSFHAQSRPDRAVIRIAGETALAFLQNLLTADLTADTASYAALLTPQGKILHDIFVVPDGDVVWLDVAHAQADDLLKRLLMYRLRAKLDIGLAVDKAVAVSGADDLPGLAYRDPRNAQMGFRAIVDADMFPTGDGYDALRLSFGLGDSTLDIGSGEMFVHEANLDLLGAVSFSKGCYVGQEVVSRTHHRGSTRSRMFSVELDGEIAAGEDITSDEKRVGKMLSSQGEIGLALLNMQKLIEATNPLRCGTTYLVVRRQAWMPEDILPKADTI